MYKVYPYGSDYRIYNEKELYTDIGIDVFVASCREAAKAYGTSEEAYLDLRVFELTEDDCKETYYYRLMGAVIPEGASAQKDSEETEGSEGDVSWQDCTGGLRTEMTFSAYARGKAVAEAAGEKEHHEPETPNPEKALRKRIRKFVNQPGAYARFDAEVRKHVLGQPNISEITYNVFVWLRGLAEGVEQRHNAMIAAPSGCGKTETYRVIKRILTRKIGDIPVIQVDVTKLTPEGFKGKDVADALDPLFTDSINGIGIVVLDEMDKRLLPCYEAHGKNVNAEVQEALLTVIEGTELSQKKTEKKINTANTLFIAAGAFQQLRTEKKKKLSARKIGFGEQQERPDERLTDITVEDILEGGAMYELMGRFSTVINYYQLDRDSVAVIVSRYVSDFKKQLGCNIRITDAAIDGLYDSYAKSGFGCRILRTTMWRRLAPAGIRLEKEQGGNKKAYCILYDKDEVTCSREEEKEMETE